MNYQNNLLFISLTTFFFILMVYKYAFVNNKPHCDHFVTNVYLYLGLSFSLVGCFIHMYNYGLNTPNQLNVLLPESKVFQQIMPYIFFLFW